jgi:hypothetical protein
MPCSSRRRTVFGPIPGIRPGEAPANRSRAISHDSTVNPSGLSASDATLATSLFGPMPIEHVSPVRSRTASLIRRAAAFGRSSGVRSMYASSRPTTCTRSTCSCSTAITSRERVR